MLRWGTFCLASDGRLGQGYLSGLCALLDVVYLRRGRFILRLRIRGARVAWKRAGRTGRGRSDGVNSGAAGSVFAPGNNDDVVTNGLKGPCRCQISRFVETTARPPLW